MLLIVAGLSIVRINSIDDIVDTFVDVDMPKVQKANLITDDLNIVARSLRNMLLVERRDEMLNENKRIDEASARITDILEDLAKVVHSERGKAILKDIEKVRGAYREAIGEVRKLALEGKKREATEVLLTQVRPAQEVYFQTVAEIIKYQTELMRSNGALAASLSQSAIVYIPVISCIALILTVILAWLLTRGIVRPIKQCIDVASHVARGDT